MESVFCARSIGPEREALLTGVEEHDEDSLVVSGREGSRGQVDEERDCRLSEVEQLSLAGREAKSIFDNDVGEGGKTVDLPVRSEWTKSKGVSRRATRGKRAGE